METFYRTPIANSGLNRKGRQLAFAVFRIEGGVIKKVKTSNKGRKCKYPHCKHTLSIYNHEDHCHVHRGQVLQEYASKGYK